MGELLANLRGHLIQVMKAWNELSPGRRTQLAGVAAVVAAVLGVFVWTTLRADYRPLYIGLTEAEAGVTVGRLEQLKVPYRLEDSGRTILVPAKYIDKARVELASEGLPTTGRMGFELFDQSSFGATEFAEQVNFRRALEGELERTITSFNEVRRARVHVSLPKRSVFLENEEPAKASVVVELEMGRQLGPESVRAIERLAASAVPGLSPGAVTVMDTQGRLFSQWREYGDDLTYQQLDYRRKLEQDTVRKITRTLEPYLGPGGLRATVAIDVDWDGGEQTEEVLDPNPVALSTQISEESNLDPIPGGAPGAASNLPRQDADLEQRGASVRRTMKTTNYQTSRTVTKLILARGAVKRMSIAVLVDYRQEVDEEARKLVRVPRTAEDLTTIRELVTAASGALLERGDTVTLHSLPFNILEPPLQLPAPPPDPADKILSLEWAYRYRVHIIGVAIGILILVALFFFLRRQRRLGKVRAERAHALTAERDRKELEVAAEVEQANRLAEEERLLKGLKLAPVQTSKTQILKKHLEEGAKEDSENFARLIRAWIHEDD